jgi:predicted phosphodiesterase
VRYLIISDLHSNLEALEAVIESARGLYDEVLCCGDVVGYGADPQATIEWVRDHVKHVIRGNHDKACAGSEDLEWFNPVAQASALWTRTVLTPENLQFLIDLPKGPLELDGFQIAHGSPVDEDEYLITTGEAAQIQGYVEADLCFFGHTHLQGGFQLLPRGVRRLGAVAASDTESILELEPDGVYLINPGSVGQPRDGDARAAYVLYDSEPRLVSYRRTPYDVTGARRKILEAGLPSLLADRLAAGL